MEVHYGTESLPKFKNAVITIGSFDGVHCGHRKILAKILELADQIGGESVVITFDPHPRHVLNPDDYSLKLLNTTGEKLKLLEQTGIHHVVVVPFSRQFASQTPDSYIDDFICALFNPKIIVIGYDHRFGANRQGDIQYLKQSQHSKGFQIYEIAKEMVDEMEVSSTIIRKAIEKGDLLTANKLLGDSYIISGTVVHGDGIGRQLGFPTANISISEPGKLIPGIGIYACTVRIANNIHHGMLYIGHRPTVDKSLKLVIEVNIFDFTSDIYDQQISLTLETFIRGDRHFDALDDLKSQIAADKETIQTFFKKKNQHLEIAIVILNYNTRNQLEQFLPTVVRYSKYPNTRIILADNGSTDDSISWVRNNIPEVEIIALDKNYGFAEGYNKALNQVQATYYVLLNSDIEVTENWLAPVIEDFGADPKIAAIQPKIKAYRQKSHFEYAGAAGGWTDILGYPFCRGRIFDTLEADTGQYNDPSDISWASGAAMFVRSALFREMGGFDGSYFAHLEEIDLCQRLKSAGYRIRYQPHSVVYHVGGGTLGYQSPFKTYLNFRNNWTTILKNESSGKLIWLIPVRISMDLLAAVVFLIKKEGPNAAAVIRGMWYNVLHLRSTFVKRRQVKKLVSASGVGPSDRSGIYRGSIVFQYYIKKIHHFSSLTIK